MKCPNCQKEDAIVADVTITVQYQLAKGGGISTAGKVVKQEDMKAAWESQKVEEDDPKNKGYKRFYYVVSCSNEECLTEFRYYPGGRGLTHADGKTIGSAKAAAGAAPAVDVTEGDISADEAPEAEAVPEAAPVVAPAPVAAAPKLRVGAPRVAVNKPS